MDIKIEKIKDDDRFNGRLKEDKLKEFCRTLEREDIISISVLEDSIVVIHV